jgi:iron complex outermembrane receptor protein
VGLRYTYEEKDFKNTTSADPIPIFFLREDFSIHEDDNWDDVTWRLVGEYELNADGMIYASISKGFKSGGFQGQPSEPISAATPFDPEEAINYELGLKSQWLDNSLRLNVALYYMDYSDLQVLQFQEVGETPDGIPLAAGVVENAADATTKGVEVEFNWAVTPYFQLFGFYAYNDTEFDNFYSDGKDLSGNQLRNAPEHSYAINARYALPLANGSELSSLLIYTWRDETYQSNENWDTNKFDDKELLEARISWRSPMDTWELSAWGKNLTDETYQIHRIAGPSEGVETASIYGIPRYYGGTISYQF